jgi:hypothetical protein
MRPTPEITHASDNEEIVLAPAPAAYAVLYNLRPIGIRRYKPSGREYMPGIFLHAATARRLARRLNALYETDAFVPVAMVPSGIPV